MTQARNIYTEPLPVFRFQVEFAEAPLQGTVQESFNLCGGAFAECTGLDATMEPKVIKAGGHNYGAYQRVGPVTFGTVILKRGITYNHDLWKWFEMINRKGAYTHRLNVTITLQEEVDQAGSQSKPPQWAVKPVLKWKLLNALPTKFKTADFNAKATEVGIQELHLVHEGLSLEAIAPSNGTAQGGTQS